MQASRLFGFMRDKRKILCLIVYILFTSAFNCNLSGDVDIQSITIPISSEPLKKNEAAKEEPVKGLLPTAKMRTETIYLVRFLEELHFINQKIGQLDQKKIIEDYLNSLDANRMILTQGDIDNFVKRFANSMEILLKGGSLMPAFVMFSDYYEKASKRLDWIIARLEKPFNFDTPNENFQPDRKNAPWPKDENAADTLWESRLKYELLNEILAYKPKIDLKKDPKKDVAKATNPEDTLPSIESALKNIPEGINILRDRYKHFKEFLSKIDENEIQEIFLNVLCHMYDPHTQFFSADSMEDFSIVLHNSLVGIGAYLREENGYCIIEQLLPGGPAEASKQIKHGDKILAVGQDNEEPVNIFGLKLRQSVKLIRGPKGTKVKLVIQPVDGNPSDRKEVVLVRDEIKLTNNLASGKLYNMTNDEGQNNKVGYIDLPAFYGDDEETKQNTTDDVKKLLKELKRLGMETLVFDLRRNGGGLLSEAIRLTGLFLENCPVVQVKDTSGKIEKHFVKGSDVEWAGPMIILVSRFSASASEIFAGALKNHRRALIVGDPHTHGKGSVQALIEMDRLSLLPRKTPYLGSVKITIQKWYLPDGSSTQQKGVAADIPLPSFNETLPLGESDMPNALPWDSIPTIPWTPLGYEKKYSFIESDLIAQLQKKNLEHQQKLEEFKILNEKITYLKTKYGQNEYSLNLPQRVTELVADNGVRKSIESKFKTIAKNKYTFQTVSLYPNTTSAASKEEPLLDELTADEFDVFERECVRIASDWLTILKQKSEALLTSTTPLEPISVNIK